jgi:GNAT superfamily N-acetyltransferase
VIEAARPGDAATLAEVFMAARREAMPWLPLLHDEADVARYFAERVLPSADVMVVRRDGALLGFLALLPDGEVDHLYVRPGEQRRGVGTELLEAAKAQCPEGLELWAFQRNMPALAFYARHGFSELRRTDGRDNKEREPDVRLGWRP